jgi:tripartite-type tricarboxylate transporter receptor subunit TctC
LIMKISFKRDLNRALNPPVRSTACNLIQCALVRALGTASLALCSLSAAGQNLSDQPIRIVTPYAPGFGFDLTLRRITPELSKLLGQTVRVEHRPVAPEQAALAAVSALVIASKPAPATASASSPEALTLVFALRTAKQFSIAPGVRVSYEPVSPFVPVLRIDSANTAGTAAGPVHYAGFIAPAGTSPQLIAQLREATFKVMAKDTLKAWTEVSGARVALIDGPSYMRFLEAERIHLKQMPDDDLATRASLNQD